MRRQREESESKASDRALERGYNDHYQPEKEFSLCLDQDRGTEDDALLRKSAAMFSL